MKNLFLAVLLLMVSLSSNTNAAPITVEQQMLDMHWEYNHPNNPVDGFKVYCNGTLAYDAANGATRLVAASDMTFSSDEPQSCYVVTYFLNHPDLGYQESPQSNAITFFTRRGVPLRSVTAEGPDVPDNFGALFQ